jgi:glycosyltransferase involved in cell wall biosynthesis
MVTDFYSPFVGGAEIAVRNLTHALAERGHTTSIATIRTDGLPEREDDGPVRIHRIRCTTQRAKLLYNQSRPWAPPIPDPEAMIALQRLVALERPNIVHGHDWLARSVLPLKRSSATRFVMTLHYYTISCAKKSLVYQGAPCSGPGLTKCLRCASGHYGLLKGPVIVLGNFALAAAERSAVDLFLPVSNATAVGNGLPGTELPYEVIPNVVWEPASFSSGEKRLIRDVPSDDFLLFIGDRRDKGTDVLLEAYHRLADAPPLVMVVKDPGKPPSAVPRNVQVVANWPNETVREAQRRCLALIAPSVWPEPFGMVIIETLDAGRPVIASRIGGITDLVQDEINGLLVPPGDPTALREAMNRVVSDVGLRESLSRNAATSAARFQPGAVIPRLEQAYERTLARSG